MDILLSVALMVVGLVVSLLWTDWIAKREAESDFWKRLKNENSPDNPQNS